MRVRFPSLAPHRAGVAELADAPDLGSGELLVQVQVLSPAPYFERQVNDMYIRRKISDIFIVHCFFIGNIPI